MSNLARFFLSGPRSAVQLELLEISHPHFSQTYRKVRNARKGVTVILEDNSEATFDYLPMSLAKKGSHDDLDSGIAITFGDLGTVLPKELDRVRTEDGFNIKPTVIYRAYSSDDLGGPLIGPFKYVVKSFSFKRDGATFEATAPQLNLSSTGMLYRIDVFFMLRGAL